MNELRKVTAKKEFNGKSLRVKVDCATRWYSTCIMIERVLRILPAMDNVLSQYLTPVSSSDSLALQRSSAVLEPFKRAISVVCCKEATLLHADEAFIASARITSRHRKRIGSHPTRGARRRVKKRENHRFKLSPGLRRLQLQLQLGIFPRRRFR